MIRANSRVAVILYACVALAILAAILARFYPAILYHIAERQYGQKIEIIDSLYEQRATMETVMERLGHPDNIVYADDCIIWLYAGPSIMQAEPTQWITVRFDVATHRMVGFGNVLS